jgi:hypothetical protein
MSCFKVDVVEIAGSGTESSRSGREAEKRMVTSRSSGSASGGARLMFAVRSEDTPTAVELTHLSIFQLSRSSSFIVQLCSIAMCKLLESEKS